MNMTIKTAKTMTALSLGLLITLGTSACIAEAPEPAPVTSSTYYTQGDQALINMVTTSEHGIILGAPEAPLKIQIAIDQQCPDCKRFAQAVDAKLTKAINSGDVQVEYFVMDFLRERSPKAWSTTAANALNVIAKSEDATQWKNVYMALYENQPMAEEEVINTDSLIKVIQSQGIKLTEQERKQIETNSYANKAKEDTDYAFSLGVTGSPNVLIDNIPQPELNNPVAFLEYLETGTLPTP